MKWNLPTLTGVRANVVSAVNGNADLPAHVKAFIVAQIESLPPEATGASVTGFCQSVNGLVNIHITVKPANVV